MNYVHEHQEKHEFALFFESLSSLCEKGTLKELVITDEELLRRITVVLRLKIGATCIFFDRKMHTLCSIEALSKKQIQFKMLSSSSNCVLTLEITFLLPLLKKDDYERALYELTALGVNTIQLITMQKTTHIWDEKKDRARAQRIIIAAAEQSKNFAFPEVKAPISLAEAINLEQLGLKKIFFDVYGTDFFTVMTEIHHEKSFHIMLLVGPEGDLTQEEKRILTDKKFIFCALTPTIIKSVQAAALGAGFVRSLFRAKSF